MGILRYKIKEQIDDRPIKKTPALLLKNKDFKSFKTKIKTCVNYIKKIKKMRNCTTHLHVVYERECDFFMKHKS